MKNKKSYWGIVLVVALIIISFGAIWYIANETKLKENTNTKAEDNNSVNEEIIQDKKDVLEEEKNKIEKDLTDIKQSLSYIIIKTYIENNNNENSYNIQSNINLLKRIDNRQLFIMEEIIKAQKNNNNFIALSSDGKEITDKFSPTDEMITVYYPYDLFNVEYKKYFNEDFNKNEAKISSYENDYDKGNYVYYNGIRPGTNGLYIDTITINNINTDNTNEFTVDITLNYSQRASSEFRINSNEASLSYERNNDNLILKSLIIK